jgi:hypothetical protein
LTQFVSGLVRAAGLDGIAYPSSQEGDQAATNVNYVFFDPTVAEPLTLQRHTVEQISYTPRRIT